MQEVVPQSRSAPTSQSTWRRPPLTLPPTASRPAPPSTRRSARQSMRQAARPRMRPLGRRRFCECRLGCKKRSSYLKRQEVETSFYHSQRHILKKIWILKIFMILDTKLAEVCEGSISFRTVLLSKYKKLIYYLLLGHAKYNILFS